MHRNIIYVCSTPPGLITEIKLQHTASSQSSQLGGRFLWSSWGWSRRTLTRDMQGAKQQQLQPTVSPEISGNSSHSLSARTRIFFQTFRCISNTVHYPFFYSSLWACLGTGNTGWGLETRCSTVLISQRRWVSCPKWRLRSNEWKASWWKTSTKPAPQLSGPSHAC